MCSGPVLSENLVHSPLVLITAEWNTQPMQFRHGRTLHSHLLPVITVMTGSHRAGSRETRDQSLGHSWRKLRDL